MKRKHLQREELEGTLLPEERANFMDSSPFSEISSPPKTVFVAVEGNYVVGGAQGTIHVGRTDSNDTVLLNIDQYSFNDTYSSEGKLPITGPLKLEGHHVDNLPERLKKQAPRGILEKLENLRGRIQGESSH